MKEEKQYRGSEKMYEQRRSRRESARANEKEREEDERRMVE